MTIQEELRRFASIIGSGNMSVTCCQAADEIDRLKETLNTAQELTLKTNLEKDDMAAFAKEWEQKFRRADDEVSMTRSLHTVLSDENRKLRSEVDRLNEVCRDALAENKQLHATIRSPETDAQSKSTLSADVLAFVQEMADYMDYMTDDELPYREFCDTHGYNCGMGTSRQISERHAATIAAIREGRVVASDNVTDADGKGLMYWRKRCEDAENHCVLLEKEWRECDRLAAEYWARVDVLSKPEPASMADWPPAKHPKEHEL